jgi:hypothetical protein
MASASDEVNRQVTRRPLTERSVATVKAGAGAAEITRRGTPRGRRTTEMASPPTVPTRIKQFQVVMEPREPATAAATIGPGEIRVVYVLDDEGKLWRKSGTGSWQQFIMPETP